MPCAAYGKSDQSASLAVWLNTHPKTDTDDAFLCADNAHRHPAMAALDTFAKMTIPLIPSADTQAANAAPSYNAASAQACY